MPKEKFDFYEHTTNIVCREIQKEIEKGSGRMPWEIPYKNFGQIRNFNSKRVYRGWINQMVLSFAGFAQPFWNTYPGWRLAAFKQWAKKTDTKLDKADLDSINAKKKSRFEKNEDWLKRQTANVQRFFADGGGGVKAGEKSTKVFFNARVPNKRHDSNDPDSREFYWIMRVFPVFNIEQTDVEVPTDTKELDFGEIEKAETIWDNWEDAPNFVADADVCAYDPWGKIGPEDTVYMVDAGKFKSDEWYYSAQFHEMVHATGHKSRLNRKECMDETQGFGTDPYCKEELTAEMGASILCAMCGIERKTQKNSVAYMTGFYERLRANPKLLVQASTKAAGAVDQILGVKYDDNSKDGE